MSISLPKDLSYLCPSNPYRGWYQMSFTTIGHESGVSMSYMERRPYEKKDYEFDLKIKIDGNKERDIPDLVNRLEKFLYENGLVRG